MKRFLLSSCYFLFVIGCASAPPAQPVPPAAPQTSGIFVSAFDGDPALDHKVVGVHVTVDDQTSDTDGAGNTSFDGLAPGLHHYALEVAGYEPSAGDFSTPHADPLNVSLVRVKPIYQARRGLVQRDGKAVVDDDGPFHPLGLTFFPAIDLNAHDHQRFLDNAKAIADGHIDYVRILGEVRWDPDPATGWPGLVMNPCADDYEQQLGATIDSLYDDFALRTELTLMGGGTGCDPMTIARKVAAVINANGRVTKIMALEASNESYDNGPDVPTLVQMVRYLRANTTVQLVALSSPFDSPGDDALRAASTEAAATLFTIHTERDGGANKWRQVRQAYNARSYSFVVDSNEPPGPHSSIDTNDNPQQLVMMRAVGVTNGAAMYVFHVGDLVMSRVDPAHNRQANLWQVPHIDVLLRAVRALDEWLPAGVENWRMTTQHGGYAFPGFENYGQVLVGDGIWTDGHDHGADRVYGATNGSAFIETVSGVKGHVNLRAERPMHAEAISIDRDTGLGSIIGSVDLAAGDVWNLPGRDDTMAAYIVRGTFQ